MAVTEAEYTTKDVPVRAPGTGCPGCAGSGVRIDDGSFSGRSGVELPCPDCSGGPLAAAYARHLQWQFHEPVWQVTARKVMLHQDFWDTCHEVIPGAGCPDGDRGRHVWRSGEDAPVLDDTSDLVIQLGSCTRCEVRLMKAAPLGREYDPAPLFELNDELAEAVRSAGGRTVDKFGGRLPTGEPALRFPPSSPVQLTQFCILTVDPNSTERCSLACYDLPGPGVCDRPAPVEVDYGGERRWACRIHAVVALDNFLGEEGLDDAPSGDVVGVVGSYPPVSQGDGVRHVAPPGVRHLWIVTCPTTDGA